MIARDPRDITKLDPSRGPPKHTLLGHFFDVDHLNASLARFCPQMRVHASVHDLYDVPSILEPLKATHREMGNVFVNETLLDAPQLWGSRLLQWVEKKTKGSSSDGLPGKDGDEKPSDIGVATIKAGLPVRVNIERSIFTWPNSHDSPQLARAFGRLLRVRGDARRIAATVLFRLQKRFRLSLDPRQYGTAGPRRESFVGVHLRTERDVAVTAPNVFPEYAFQAADYAAYVAESKIPVVFLATGASPENVTAFAERMAKLNVTVVTKMDLLQDEDGPERSALEDLTFDQRGLIDYEVMLRAGLVAGRCESAFAWQLVLRRASAFAGIVGGDTKIRPHDGYRYQDRYSALFGKPDCSNMMQASIWP